MVFSFVEWLLLSMVIGTGGGGRGWGLGGGATYAPTCDFFSPIVLIIFNNSPVPTTNSASAYQSASAPPHTLTPHSQSRPYFPAQVCVDIELLVYGSMVYYSVICGLTLLTIGLDSHWPNALVGAGFASRHQLQTRAGFKKTQCVRARSQPLLSH